MTTNKTHLLNRQALAHTAGMIHGFRSVKSGQALTKIKQVLLRIAKDIAASYLPDGYQWEADVSEQNGGEYTFRAILFAPNELFRPNDPTVFPDIDNATNDLTSHVVQAIEALGLVVTKVGGYGTGNTDVIFNFPFNARDLAPIRREFAKFLKSPYVYTSNPNDAVVLSAANWDKNTALADKEATEAWCAKQGFTVEGSVDSGFFIPDSLNGKWVYDNIDKFETDDRGMIKVWVYDALIYRK